jgi:hydroxymethylglutaryl-CoA lyase
MIRIVELAARDGLQNEAVVVPTADKVAFVDALSRTGVPEIEVSAFVSRRRIPQLADAEEVFERIARAPGVVYSALVPNEIGLDRALASRAGKIAVFTAASETFNRKNINAGIAESFERFAPVVGRAKSAGLPVRGYVSTAFFCPYEGKIDPARAVEVAERLLDLGCDELSIGDTIGRAAPDEVAVLLERLLDRAPAGRLAMHFHDTFGRAVDNVVAAWRLGIETFDASAGGIGGCPFAPGASGNVATEAVVRALMERGAGVGVDLGALAAARKVLASLLGRDPGAASRP